MWIAENEGAKFWLSVLTEIKNRGVQDILIACIDGLKGFADAIATVYPQTRIQLCIIHMVHNNLKYVSWKDYKAVTSDLKRYLPISDRRGCFTGIRGLCWYGMASIRRSANLGTHIGRISMPCLPIQLISVKRFTPPMRLSH